MDNFERKDIKVCFAASSGGHLEQMLSLEPLMKRYSSFILTERTPYAATLPVQAHYVWQINRHKPSFIPLAIANGILSIGIWIKERPDVIISTGALATIPFCLIGHFFGARLVFIESFAKIDSPTLTGKLLYRYADRFYVQWESMMPFYPNARYIGGIY